MNSNRNLLYASLTCLTEQKKICFVEGLRALLHGGCLYLGIYKHAPFSINLPCTVNTSKV
jgi:hypothetical protein